MAFEILITIETQLTLLKQNCNMLTSWYLCHSESEFMPC